MKRQLFILLISMVITGCTTTLSNTVHHSVSQSPELKKPKKLIVLPVDVVINEVTASGKVEEVPSWSEKGRRLVEGYVNNVLNDMQTIDLIAVPELSDAQQTLLNQHIALYNVVSLNALTFRNHAAWKSLREKEGYSLGKGLAFLYDKTDADAALIVIGQDFIASTGRKTAAVFAAVLGGVVTMGRAVLHAGVIDLKTGNILWMNTSTSDSLSLNKENDTESMVTNVFKTYMHVKE